MLLSNHTPLIAFSECSSTIRRTQQALYPWALRWATSNTALYFLAFAHLPPRRSIPPRSRPSGTPRGSDSWSLGEFHYCRSHPHFRLQLGGVTRGSRPSGNVAVASQWHPLQWLTQTPSPSSPKQAEYVKQRDMKHIYANAPTQWTKYCASLIWLSSPRPRVGLPDK